MHKYSIYKMPAEFERMRKAILKSLKDDPKYKNKSQKELEDLSYAMATSQWKKGHGGNAPQKAKLSLIEYFVPISESNTEGSDFRIRGVAISETTTSNNHKFVAEELRKSAGSLNGVPLLVDHSNTVESIKGRVMRAEFDEINKNIPFEAKVVDEKIQKMIKDGLLNTVSIGATVEGLEESDDGSLIAKGITFKELSLVAVPADSNATFAMAMFEAFKRLKESEDEEEEEEPDFEIDEKVQMKCSECNYVGQSTKEGMCPKCGAKMQLMDKSYSEKDNTQLKGGSKMVETDASKEANEVELVKSKLAEAEKILAEYKAKERESLIASYNKTCEERGISPVDVSAMTEETIKVLMSQISSIQKKEVEQKIEKVEKVEKEVEVKATGELDMIEGSGSLRGGSFTIVGKY